MSTIQSGRYEHKRRGPWGLMCYAFAAAFLTASYHSPVPALSITFLVTGIFLLVLGASLGRLIVEDQGDHIAVHFGPLPLFRKRIRCEDIVEVEMGRTNFLDGWQVPRRRSVIVEVYPPILRRRYPTEGRTGDQHDAYAISRWLSEMDRGLVLDRYFDPPLDKDEQEIADLEGWILGVM
ncbi:MAG: hypothetical protein ACQESR_00060 [Planctomycetota bacterium]